MIFPDFCPAIILATTLLHRKTLFKVARTTASQPFSLRSRKGGLEVARGVIHQNIDSGEGLHGRLYRLSHLSRVPDIGNRGQSMSALLAQIPGRCLNRLSNLNGF